MKLSSCRIPTAHRSIVFGIAFSLHAAIVPACWSSEMWSVDRAAPLGQIQIIRHDRPFATYSYRDPEIARPYFANIFAPSGDKITRNHPPAPEDPQDHEKMHPGMWLAFGDLSGADSWRLKAPIEHVRFVDQPRVDGDTVSFAVENRYLAAVGQRELCRETCRYAFHALPQGVLALWDSRFHSAADQFVFGDQEELGLGVRLAGDVAVKSGRGGRILNSNGQRNEAEAWGQQADWCDYSGVVDGEFVGITIMPHPENFRRAWCHCRDTGFMAMNPFGRNAFTGGEKSAVVVPPGDGFRLRYGVLFHWNKTADDFDARASYNSYLKMIGQ